MEDPKNIEKPIPRSLVKNCATSVVSSQLNREGKKLVATKCTLDAFGKVINMVAVQNYNESHGVSSHPYAILSF